MSIMNHNIVTKIITPSIIYFVVNKSTKEKKIKFIKYKEFKWSQKKSGSKIGQIENKEKAVEFKHKHIILSERIVISIQVKRKKLSDFIKKQDSTIRNAFKNHTAYIL